MASARCSGSDGLAWLAAQIPEPMPRRAVPAAAEDAAAASEATLPAWAPPQPPPLQQPAQPAARGDGALPPVTGTDAPLHLQGAPGAQHQQQWSVWGPADPQAPPREPLSQQLRGAAPREPPPAPPDQDRRAPSSGPRLSTERSRLQRQKGQPLAEQLDPLPQPQPEEVASGAPAPPPPSSALGNGAYVHPKASQEGAAQPLTTSGSHATDPAAPAGKGASRSNGSQAIGNDGGSELEVHGVEGEEEGSDGHSTQPHRFAHTGPRPSKASWMQNPVPLKAVEPTDEWFFLSGTFKRKAASS